MSAMEAVFSLVAWVFRLSAMLNKLSTPEDVGSLFSVAKMPTDACHQPGAITTTDMSTLKAADLATR